MENHLKSTVELLDSGDTGQCFLWEALVHTTANKISFCPDLVTWPQCEFHSQLSD